jgi:hypothetical protein
MIALVAWLIGSLALRIAGVLFVLAGVVGAANGQTQGLFVAMVGAVAWLAGHWLFGIRHHHYCFPSPDGSFSKRRYAASTHPAAGLWPPSRTTTGPAGAHFERIGRAGVAG